MIIIGVTGATGSGKSTVCNMLEDIYGFKVINADAIAYSQATPGSDYLNEINKTFGSKVINKDGSLNRTVLGNIIFNDVNERIKLNKITKKFVVREIEDLITIFKDISKTADSDANLKKYMSALVIDAPLLYEFKLDKECNYIITVTASDELKIQRIIERQGLDKQDAQARINSQREYDSINKNADYFIENNGTEDELRVKMRCIIEEIARKEKLKLH